MKKLLKPKDFLLLALSGIGDLMEETRDPLHLVSSGYESVYGFMPKRYKRRDYYQTVSRSLKTGDIEKIVKDGKTYLRLTSVGQKKIKRDFAVNDLTKNWNKKWVIISFDIEEKSRRVRNSLRNKLKNLGFGMFQKSIWITPLPIGKDLLEFIQSLGLSNFAYVFEVSALVLGDPKKLADKIWNLSKYKEEYLKLRDEIKRVNQLIASLDDRHKSREANSLLKTGYQYELRNKQKELRRKYLEFILSLPNVPRALFPLEMQSLRPFHSF